MCYHWLLILLAVYWLSISCFSAYYINKSWPRLTSYFRQRPNLDPAYLPFYRDDFQSWNKTAILCKCFILLPPKLCALLLFCVFAGAFAFLIAKVEKILSRKSLFLRKQFKLYMNYAGWLACWCFVTIKENNLNEATSTQSFIVSNHISLIQIVYLCACKWPVSFIAREDVERMPLVGTVASFGDSIYIDRRVSSTRAAALEQIKNRVTQAADTPPLVVFSEGAATNGKYILKFKTGAFEPMAPIKLIGFKWSCGNLNLATDDMGILCNILLLFCHSPTMQVNIINNYGPKGSNPQEYSQAARADIANMVGAIPADSRFRDKIAFSKLLADEYAEEQKKQQ